MDPAILIFLIDDDLDDQEIFSFVLQEINPDIELLCASDGVTAINMLNSDPAFTPDYIFLDINMPQMNGVECLTALKAVKRISGIPIYLYSTADEIYLVQQNVETNPHGFIKKEANADLIREKILQILGMKTKLDHPVVDLL